MNDILSNIERIGEYTSAMTAEQFAADAKTRDATQHCLLRISEAATKLGELAESEVPDQPWGEIRGLGNRLRHEYDRDGGPPVIATRLQRRGQAPSNKD